MKLLMSLFSKKVQKEYSSKFMISYNEVNNRTEEIYINAINEYNKQKETSEHAA